MKKDNGRTARRTQLWRIEEIRKRISQGDYPNCVQLAKEMEVSVITVKRDIEFMRNELGWPIDYDEKRYGFYIIQSGDKGFGFGLGAAELQDLAEACNAVSQYVGTPVERLMREAFQQMKEDLGLGRYKSFVDTLNGAISFRPFAPVKIDMKALQVIIRATLRKRALQFKFKAPGKAEEERRGLPQHIACINHCWYVFLYSMGKGDVEPLPIYQMREPTILTRRFVGPKEFNLEEHLLGALMVATGKENHEVIVELDAWATDIIRSRHLPAIEKIVDLPDCCSRVHMRLSTLDEIERWIFVLTTHATVLEPPVLRERMLKTIEELSKRYAS